MKSLKQDQKTALFTKGVETKSKADATRKAKTEEERVIEEVNSFVDGLVEKYGEAIGVDEYLKLGYFKLVNKDGNIEIKFKR